MTSHLPLVSILIPVFNRQDLVLSALDSALAQTYSNIEVIAFDNGSSDRTFDVLQEYATKDPRVRAFRSERNTGPVSNWRRCVEHSRGSLVKILFSDDWLEVDALERLVQPLVNRSDVGFSYSAVSIHRENGKTDKAYQLAHEGVLPSLAFLKAEIAGLLPVPVSPGCALFRRADVLAGLLEEIPNRLAWKCDEIGMGNDLLLLLKTCARYPYVFHIPSFLVHFRAHEGSFSVDTERSSPRMSSDCYSNAIAHFLATEQLERSQRRMLQTLLLVRILGQRWSKGMWHRIQDYRQLFPPEYHHFSLDFRTLGAALSRQLLGRLKHEVQGCFHGWHSPP